MSVAAPRGPRRFLSATLETVAAAIPTGVAMTPREIEKRLAVYYARSTVRAVLIQLSRQGCVLAEGNIDQRRYRLNPDCQCCVASTLKPERADA